MSSTTISENSRRIARNTVLMYIRMFLLMFLGLFTSRIILQTLGKADFGTFGVVGGVVTMFTMFTNAVSSSIGRYITSELGRGNMDKLKAIFSTSVVIQIIICVILFVFVETAGVWFLNNRMDIPEGRLGAANWVLQCAMIQLFINLFSVPFNVVIVAHEHLKAYAYISILEAVLKLSVALMLMFSGFDKLKTYAVLMVASCFIVRMAYRMYCHKHFEESRTKLVLHKDLVKEMLGYAGWNTLPSCVSVVNTQGLNVLSNLYFGVVVNAVRQVALQVEGTVRQCVNNVGNAISPQITKSYAAGNKDYSYVLTSKAGKYAYLIILFFVAPFLFEGQTLLHLWLGNVPEGANLFTNLALLCLLPDSISTFATLVSAEGRIKYYSIFTSLLSLLIFPITWLVFKLGGDAYTAYVVFFAVSCAQVGLRLWFANRLTGYPCRFFFVEVLGRVAVPTLAAVLAGFAVTLLIPVASWWRMLINLVVISSAIAVTVYFFSLTDGERSFVAGKLRSVVQKFRRS